ncbi:NAD(P)H-binding protein [Burkholderia cenocepacia]|uniref:NmrA family NAD(P)-binding protein n=1 Tax=Burkholderia cenocepacia TaxID=95486 RepID=UPI0018AD0B63|nr:NAD(P)H-binding protein [Burkholderia cenocepacia]
MCSLYGKQEIGLLGATGGLGMRVARRLMAHGHMARLIIRQPEKFPKTSHAVAMGNLDQPDTLISAMSGLSTLIVITADGPRQYEQGAAAIDAALACGVRRIILVSAMLAGEPAPRSFADRHARIEKKLAETGLEYLIVRPSFFMQSFWKFTNFRRRTIQVPVPTGRVAFVDAEDVAEAVAISADIERAIPSSGTHILTGSESFSFSEVAQLMTNSLGEKFKHVAPPLCAVKLVLPFVVGRELSSMLTYLFDCIEAGHEANPTGDLKRLLGREPGTFRQCIQREPGGFLGVMRNH